MRSKGYHSTVTYILVLHLHGHSNSSVSIHFFFFTQKNEVHFAVPQQSFYAHIWDINHTQSTQFSVEWSINNAFVLKKQCHYKRGWSYRVKAIFAAYWLNSELFSNPKDNLLAECKSPELHSNCFCLELILGKNIDADLGSVHSYIKLVIQHSGLHWLQQKRDTTEAFMSACTHLRFYNELGSRTTTGVKRTSVLLKQTNVLMEIQIQSSQNALSLLNNQPLEQGGHWEESDSNPVHQTQKLPAIISPFLNQILTNKQNSEVTRQKRFSDRHKFPKWKILTSF